MMAKSHSMSKNFKGTYGFLRAQPDGLIDPSLLREPTVTSLSGYKLQGLNHLRFSLEEGLKGNLRFPLK